VLVPDYIDIRYTVADRYGFPSPEPNERLDSIVGMITAQVADGEAQPVGELSLARIDLWEDDLDLFEVLDAESSEWAAYWPALDELLDDGVDFRHVLICDRVNVVEQARGRRIGLHALARAIRTWGEDALVVLFASPVDGEERDAGQQRAARAALAAYWGRLGLEVFEGEGYGEDDPPLLFGDMTRRDVSDRIAQLIYWPLPAKR
jgi:hypothetical protein